MHPLILQTIFFEAPKGGFTLPLPPPTVPARSVVRFPGIDVALVILLLARAGNTRFDLGDAWIYKHVPQTAGRSTFSDLHYSRDEPRPQAGERKSLKNRCVLSVFLFGQFSCFHHRVVSD